MKNSVEHQIKQAGMKSKARRKKRFILEGAVILFVLVTFFTCSIHFVFAGSAKKDTDVRCAKMADRNDVQLEKKEMPRTVHPKKQVMTMYLKNTNKVKEQKNLETAQVAFKKDEPFPYKKNVPVPRTHQEYLYKLSEERGLDYNKALAVIGHESKFDPNAIGETADYGYFQINKINHTTLSKELNTPNSPLDPYVNINWGTKMLSDLYEYWGDRGVKGQLLDEYVWSSYNRGINGFKENGMATEYVHKVKESLLKI